MGSAASIDKEDREVVKKSIYTAAAAAVQRKEQEEEDFEGEYDEGEAPEERFPKKILNRFVSGKATKEETAQEVSIWAKAKRDDELEEIHLWQEAMEELKYTEPFEPALKLMVEVMEPPDPEVVLHASLRHQTLGKQVVSILSLETLKDGARIMEAFFPGSPGEVYEEKWRVDFYMDELLPRGKVAILEFLAQKNEYGRCKALQEQLECGMLHAAGEMLRLGADPQGLLDEADAKQVLELFHQVNEHTATWPLDKQLRVALARGDAQQVRKLVEDKANVNLDRCDGDSRCFSPLALSMMKRWDSIVNRFLLDGPSGYDVLRPSSLETFKLLLANPEVDPNRGGYSYGWHGSFVRATTLGLALMGEFDTGSCYSSPQADLGLVAPRREILELLAHDPRVDLEEVFHERGEESEAPKMGALTFLDLRCSYNFPLDLLAAKILMQAGALMTKNWLKLLEQLDQGEVDALKEELEKAREEEKRERARKEEPIVRDGITYVTAAYPPELPLSQVIQLRIDEIQEVKEWYGVVKSGSNVFKSPAAFPANFCRAAAALDRALKKSIGRGGVCRVLDFLYFFEFNRRRVKTNYHDTSNLFGRPLVEPMLSAEKLERRIQKKMEAEDEEGGVYEEEEAPAEVENDTCWVLEEDEVGKADEDDEEMDEKTEDAYAGWSR